MLPLISSRISSAVLALPSAIKPAPEPIALREKKERLTHLLSRMSVPQMRRQLSEENLRWLSRNLALQNDRQIDLPEALELVKKLLAK